MHGEHAEARFGAAPRPSGRTSPVWPRVRDMLVLAGDVVGVLVLIVAAALIGAHDTVLDLLRVLSDR